MPVLHGREAQIIQQFIIIRVTHGGFLEFIDIWCTMEPWCKASSSYTGSPWEFPRANIYTGTPAQAPIGGDIFTCTFWETQTGVDLNTGVLQKFYGVLIYFGAPWEALFRAGICISSP